MHSTAIHLKPFINQSEFSVHYNLIFIIIYITFTTFTIKPCMFIWVAADRLPLFAFHHLHTRAHTHSLVSLFFFLSVSLPGSLCSLVPFTWGACFLKATPPRLAARQGQHDRICPLLPYLSVGFFDFAQLRARLLPDMKGLSSPGSIREQTRPRATERARVYLTHKHTGLHDGRKQLIMQHRVFRG